MDMVTSEYVLIPTKSACCARSAASGKNLFITSVKTPTWLGLGLGLGFGLGFGFGFRFGLGLGLGLG